MILPDENDDDVTLVLSIGETVFAAIERIAGELTIRPAELARRALIEAFQPVERFHAP